MSRDRVNVTAPFRGVVARDGGSTRGARNTLTARYHASYSLHLLSGAKDYINSGLASDHRNEVGPATGKRAAPDLEALAERCYTGRLDGSS